MTEMNEQANNAIESSTLLDCKCGFEAGKVGYMGGRSNRWAIRCTNSKCHANIAADSKERAEFIWNEMQSNDKISGDCHEKETE